LKVIYYVPLSKFAFKLKLRRYNKAGQHAALSGLVREAVLPHVSLTAADRDMLAEDPEEYLRQNAVGDAAALDDEVLDGGGSGGVTARRAALDFVAALVAAPGMGAIENNHSTDVELPPAPRVSMSVHPGRLLRTSTRPTLNLLLLLLRASV